LPPPAAEPYVPAREPEFGFESSDTISDEALADYHVVLACAVGGEDVGSITLDLWSEAAPITVRNFLRLCDEGFYDGITFHGSCATSWFRAGTRPVPAAATVRTG
jgi:peptidyl-prolyl cis-trans isomerase B (cyclophilin B)